MSGANPITREQVKAVLNQTDTNREKALLTLGFQTGYRGGELLSLTIADLIDNHGNVKPVITVTASRMKGKKHERTVRLNIDTQQSIKVLYKELKVNGCARRGDAIFQSRQGYKGKALGLRQLNNVIKELFAIAGCIGKFSSHSLRKTFAEQCRCIFGGDILKIQKALGHADIRATIRYLSWVDEEILEGIRSINYV